MTIAQVLLQQPTALLNRKTLKGLLSDCLCNDIAKVNVMLAVFDDGILDYIRNNPSASELEWNNYVRRISYERALIDDKADWAVKEWRKILSPSLYKRIEENRNKQAQEPNEQEAFQSNLRDSKQHQRTDFDRYYINPTIVLDPKRIFIPCGVGKTDYGFFIHGIARNNICNHVAGNVYALVYNFLTRNSRIEKQDIPSFISEQQSTYSIDYKSVFRASMVLLQIIRNNGISTQSYVFNIKPATMEDRDAFQMACLLVNHYAQMFCGLMKIKSNMLQISKSASAKTVSVFAKADIYVTSNTETENNAREIWFGKRINYRLTREDRPAVEALLREISPFSGFKEGQYTALCSMLSAKQHAVCIMPTGSGKSLIYYLASILQPLPVMIIAPTEILIEDQLRNLKKYHRIDNAAHILVSEQFPISKYSIQNSLVYVTPMTLQNHFLHEKLRHLNNGTQPKGMGTVTVSPGPMLSYVVLDEIHCLSNWGHDFRPEYLMLSKALNKYLDRVNLWGFTATANYTVADDIMKQLEIPQENFFSPIPFDKYNITYSFQSAKDSGGMRDIFAKIISDIILRGERTIVFTKSDDVSKQLADIAGYEADVFSSDAPTTYYQFADGKCQILIASEELGVGINLPNVRNVIHYGLPLSKNEYVQEIGRAGRENENVTSYVIYLQNTEVNIPPQLLRRDTDMRDIPQLLKGIYNDFGDVYRKLTDNCPTPEVLFKKLNKVFMQMSRDYRSVITQYYQPDEIDDVKKLLYMLYILGYVRDWYTLGWDKKENAIAIQMDICSQDAEKYAYNNEAMTRRMQASLVEYFTFLGEEREHISKAGRASSSSELLKVYVDWYYRKYLYQHNEQFLDLYEFIVENADGDVRTVNNEIKDYFGLPFLKMRSDEAYYDDLQLKAIAEKIAFGVDSTTIANIERINSNRYSYRLDYFLFCSNLKNRSFLDNDRLRRLVARTPGHEFDQLSEGLAIVYGSCSTEIKLQLLTYIRSSKNQLKCDYHGFLKAAYENGPADIIYYGLMAERINKLL